ncbi:MAG: PVC-type heme-binding CxxCH protein [Verrucomicrobiota bacterium]
MKPVHITGLLIAWASITAPLSAHLPEGVVDTQPGDEQPPSPKASLETITVPDGFHISLFAGEPDVAQPVAIEYDDRGRLWVLESYSYIEWKRAGKDRLLIFEDTDNDGQFETRKVFWDKGNHTSGFQIGFGGVWVCDAPELLFIPDADRNDVPDGQAEVILDGWTTEAEHNFFNGLTWGPDGWLYGRHGIKKPSLVGKPGTPDAERVALSCGIWRYHPVKKRFELWADGTVNPWGLDWNEEGEGFINTSVIDHLWHLVPGARFQRWPGQGTASLNPHSYDLMQPTSDHRHWSGGQTGRKDVTGNDEAGGGHSHCGLVIYQSNAWPEEYHGRAFFSNVLGQRINTDHLERLGSAWTARHGEDFLRSSSPWFRAVDLKQGPSGEIMIAEWTDLGECHDRDGIHRSSGRLYEVWYGDRPQRGAFDVSKQSTKSLLSLLFHENVWWRRHALRNLHERVAKGESLKPPQVADLITKPKRASVRDAVSAVQALHAIDHPPMEWVPNVYTGTSEEAVRIHLLTLTLTEETPSPDVVAWFQNIAAQESTLSVQYRMSALLQRIPVKDRWSLAESLARVPIPQQDRNFALVRWYGFEPLVEDDPARAMKVALETGHPWLSQAIAKRIVSADALPVAITALTSGNLPSEPLTSILTGLLEALPARGEMPAGWNQLYKRLSNTRDAAAQRQAFQLAQRFGDPNAETEMLARVLHENTPKAHRLDYFRMLIAARSQKIRKHIPDLIAVPALAADAIRAEAAFPSDDSAPRLLNILADSSNTAAADPDRVTAILETLASRQDFADSLVDAVLSDQVQKESIPAYIARQLTIVSSKKEAFAKHIGLDAKDAAQRARLIESWKKKLSDDYLAHANPVEGRDVYRRICASCHRLYDEGGPIGPDLTGSGRADLDYFLINVLFPSEDVSPDYRLVTLSLANGRTLTGNIVEENSQVITFRQVGQVERIDTSQVVQRQVSDLSLMPSGLLDTLRREDVRDLVGYLRTTKPLP